MAQDDDQLYRIQYSHDKKRWIDYGPSTAEGCIPILFPSIRRCREICNNCLGSTYGGHRWYQRILTQAGEVVEYVHCDKEADDNAITGD